MSFDRFRTQTAIELELGCSDVSKWKDYKSNFESFQVTTSRKEKLLIELKADACDLYFKAIFSIADALSNLYEGRHSWSVVKLYYSIFYLLRCIMATHGIAFVKNNGIYTIKFDIGESPIKRDKGTHMGQRISGDHKTTIATYIYLFKDNDILQTNTINGSVVYDWIMELRNQVNYRERAFQEPIHKYFYESIFDKNHFKTQVETYINDDTFVYCFDEDHCCLAAPLKLALLTKTKLATFVDFEPIEPEKIKEIERLLSTTGLTSSNEFIQFYNFNNNSFVGRQ